nr:TIM barrel protein [Candidatus Sigynarchaeum springense]
MKQGHDYFGFSLWHDLLAGNSDWMKTMELGDPREFDPEEDGWRNIFSRLARVHAESGLSDALGACFHVSSDFAAMMVDPGFNLLETFNSARKDFSEKVPFELGMHCTFGLADLPLAGRYPAVLKRDLELAEAIGASCIVCHPPKGRENRMEKFADELASEPVVEALTLSNPGIVLAWENAGPDSFFGSLEHYIEFRGQLADKLAAAGHSKLLDRHVFCLDTGHLLVWKYKGKKGKRGSQKEIEATLPSFAKLVKVFHIHANDGKSDQHLVPGSLYNFDHPTRKSVNKKRFLACSNEALGFIETCELNKGITGRHVHVEALKMPFNLEAISEFGRSYSTLLSRLRQ